MRRDVHGMSEREARVIERLGRMNRRLDDVHMRLDAAEAARPPGP
ncbi:hypothetical protein J2X36_002381 [Methylobacterium sp. BE186]|nr:hypothetical protein [Methylobacterium sp. BE186]MDR7037634.1 hypothetical protein [Methylobacterium sp. BE186]